MDEDEILDPATEARRDLDPDARICGHCLAWRPKYQDEQDRWTGPCPLMPHRGDFPATAPICDRFMPRGSKVPVSAPPEAGRRRAKTRQGGPVLRRPGAPERPVRLATPKPDVELGDLFDMTRNELIEILREALDEGPLPELAPKWEGGTLVLKPGNDTQPKEIPLDALLRKVVSIRDKLRVLEAKINAHDKLSEAEKVDLEGYVTRCYGSLTTFNVLFKDESDKFHGTGG